MGLSSVPDQYVAPVPLTPKELAALPHDNAAPKMIASIWSLVAVATAFLILRIYCRLLKRQSLWWDDAILIASWVCIVIESSLLTHITTLGYGLHIWDFDQRNMQYLTLPMNVAGTLSITAAVWSKTSFGITLLHVTDGWIKNTTWFCIISMNIAICDPVQKSWDMTVQGSCWDPRVVVYYGMFSGGYSALMDFTLALLPWKFLWGLQMKRKEKIGVGIAMSMGILAGLMGVVKTAKIHTMLSTDFADSIPLWARGNAEVCASIIAASIPMLRVLVRDAQSSGQDHSGYYDDSEVGVTGKSSRFVSITSRPPPANSDVELHKLGDDRSDRSILGNNAQTSNGIVQVTDISIKDDEDTGGEEARVEGTRGN
ncbi:hypothetical protein C8A00DRAFT_40266 [Chaetomidium leptoderma]|uniref:Rhodopsin domain-containing protein n=1 Tax=Chaetomidium leptoderma TaxID=669021 RepID=A0AAN6VVI4_9PEZI|nr:hypothetical protein C8A00DRAFT_40266 [Chaetomidium leptoderma]